MNLRYARISEIIWLIITILTTGIAVYMVYSGGSGEWTYFIIAFVAAAMYGFRRMLRIRFEKNQTKPGQS